MITFYLPSQYVPAPAKSGQAFFTPVGDGKAAAGQSWIYQTWLELKDEPGVTLANELPSAGLIIAMAGNLPRSFRAAPEQFVAAIVADSLPHPGAQVQIVQNRRHAEKLRGSIFMPHWPQPCLIPRDAARGERFETLAYFGDIKNLAPELAGEAWQRQLIDETGVRFEIRGAGRWHDFSDVDAVLAIRDFSCATQIHKPPTKLYNAWLAGVPFIGGADSAYQAERRSEWDYMEAGSADEVIELVRRLKDDPALRARIQNQAAARSAECSRARIRERWRGLIGSELPRLRDVWAGGEWGWMRQRVRFWVDEKFRR